MRVVQLALALSSSKRVFRARFDARRAWLGTSVTAQMALAVFLMLPRESAATPPPLPPHCNVLVAGGSTAALAVAITAAVAGPNLTVCLTEPTDTLGGQLAFNPAIDFGDLGSTAAQGAELKALVAALKPPQHSPSPCWVSTACYPPARLAAWIARRLSTLPNLTVLRRTAVLGTRRDNATGRVLGLELVSRAPINNGGAEDGQDEWGARLSDSLPDWYSPLPSARFTKASGVVAADVVVEATELGDVLVTAGLPFTQGVEIPAERSLTTDDGLTQSVSFAFFAQLLPAPSPPDPAPQGGDGVDSWAPPFWGAPPGKSCCCSGSNEVSPPPAEQRGLATPRQHVSRQADAQHLMRLGGAVLVGRGLAVPKIGCGRSGQLTRGRRRHRRRVDAELGARQRHACGMHPGPGPNPRGRGGQRLGRWGQPFCDSAHRRPSVRHPTFIMAEATRIDFGLIRCSLAGLAGFGRSSTPSPGLRRGSSSTANTPIVLSG